ncbi:phage tail tip lysozyme [Ancylobacter terrae]|uniref:phage tail tip lysozyme n=1 Tax=Ancylobacter sp. sgz301288 TaxID=3342077 RepID=UPI003858DC47
MAGSGLPIPESGVLAQGPGVIDGDGLTSARSWASIAASGAKLANAAGNLLEQEHRQALIGRLADRDTTDRKRAIELQDMFREDPGGFQRAWQGYREGVLSSIEPDLVPHARATLGSLGNSAFGEILDRKRTRDRQQDTERVNALVEATANDLTATAMRGELGSEKGQITAVKLRSVLDSAVSSGLVTREKADLRLNQILGDAQAEGVLHSAKSAYDDARATGSDALGAARKVVEERILNNPELPLSADDRRAYASKITAELGAEEALRRQDLSIARKAATDAQAAMQGGVRVSPETIDSLADQLSANGGQADAARLRAAAARADRLRDFGRQPLAQQVQQFEQLVPPSARERAAMEFYIAKGWSPAQAAGIVGNLVGESGRGLDPTLSHDGGTGLGIAGWRDEAPGQGRKTALEKFAQARGKPATDFETQLEFLHHELTTTEKAAGDKLRAATDPRAAAVAMLDFERPGGWKPGDPTGSNGYQNRQNDAARLAGAKSGDTEPDLRFAKEAQSELAKSVARDWKKLSADLDAGVRPAPGALAALINGATLSGDSDLLEDIGERLDRYDAARSLERDSLGAQQAAVSSAEQAGAAGVLPPGRSAWLRDFASVRDATIAGLDRDPVGLGVDDLAGVQTLSGSPVTPEYLRGSAKLDTVGDGRYLVRLTAIRPGRPTL